MTYEQAKKLCDSGWWKDKTDRELAEFQLFERRLCMPWERFHQAVSKALGRPVYTHEFGLNVEGLRQELFGHRPPPTLQEIIEMIPADKRIIVTT